MGASEAFFVIVLWKPVMGMSYFGPVLFNTANESNSRLFLILGADK